MRLPPQVATARARWVVTAATFATACAVAVLHAPGHVSMDTSIQLHEAHVGSSISWNPPFMSALMRWVGGGELATTALVIVQVLLLYGGTLLTTDTLLRERTRAGLDTVPAWTLLLAIAIVLNPVVALYSGIVWKDVLFAALLLAAAALAIAALTVSGTIRFVCVAGSVLLLAPALLARQQGVFMAPLLLLMLLSAKELRMPSWRWAALAAAFVAAVLTLQHLVADAVRDGGSRSTALGFRSIMIFDMMGVLARTQRSPAELAVPVTRSQLDAIRRVYQSSRIDYISSDPLAEAWAGSFDSTALRRAWWQLIWQEPGYWLRHRAAAYATLLGLRGVQATQPIFMGVEGNSAYLKEVGLKEGRTARDLLIWRYANSTLWWPIWYHAFWLSILGGCSLAWALRPLAPEMRRATGFVIVACGLFYASYLPTTIASDFRYLFGAIPLIQVLLLAIAFAPHRTERVP